MLDTQPSITLFVALIGISVAAVALISLRLKIERRRPKPRGSRISDLEPPIYRSVGYVFLAFFCSLVGLGFSLLLAVAARILTVICGSDSLACSVFTVFQWIVGWGLVPLTLFLVLAFLYIGVGHLFNMTLRQGRPTGTMLSRVRGSRRLTDLVVKIGDRIARDLFPNRRSRD